jgi:hypothetical protein
MMILQAGSRSKGVRIKVEGVFLDLASASILDPRNGDAPPTCMEPQGIVEDAITRRRGLCEGSRHTDHGPVAGGPLSP